MPAASAAPLPWSCASCGAAIEDACATLTQRCTVDAELVTHRLEVAGATLLAMRDRHPGPAPYRCALPEVLHGFWDAYGRDTTSETENRPSPPPGRAIDAMDATYAWLALIPQHRFVLRRIVAARSLIHPTTGKHVYTWRRLGDVIHADYRAVKRWHRQGIAIIVAALGK